MRRAMAVWHGMKQLYGVSFVTIYGETPTALWLHEIAGLTDKQCRDGLSKLAKTPRQYPANLTEFVEACKPTPGSPRYLGTPTTPEAMRRLAPPKANRAHVDECLARMRAKLA